MTLHKHFSTTNAKPLNSRERWLVNPMASAEELVMNDPDRFFERVMPLEEELEILEGRMQHMARSGPRYSNEDVRRINNRYLQVKSMIDNSPGYEPNS